MTVVIALVLRFTFRGVDVVEVLERIGPGGGLPTTIRVDQGTEFVSRDLLSLQYRGEERTTEIPLTQEMMRQLAIEAWPRDMKMGVVVSEVIIGVIKRNLFHPALDRTKS